MKYKIGFCLTGSFCTISKTLEQMEILSKNYELIPIVSETIQTYNTRFGKAKEIIEKLEDISHRKIISNIVEAEPIGPKNLTDIMIIAPCTGNTMAKLALGIVDNTVTMAAKSHLRNSRPVVIAISTNNALSGAAENIGRLLNRKNYYFVPVRQDNPITKPNSLVFDPKLIKSTLEEALDRNQIQPFFL